MSEVRISTVDETIGLKQPGFMKRILWTLVSPGKLMESLAQKPRVLFGLFLSALYMDIFYLSRLSLYKVYLRDTLVATSKYTDSLMGTTTTPAMIDAKMPAYLIQSLIQTPIMSLIMFVVITAIFFGIFKMIGGQGKFKAYLSVMGYSYIIMALYRLLMIGVSFITGSLNMNVPIASLATLAPSDLSGSFLDGMLKGIDVFSIWQYGVLAIGFTAVSKLKKSYVYSAVAVLFIIGLVIAGFSETALKAFM